MEIYGDNSGFENECGSVLDPNNASLTEILSLQSKASLVYKTRINDRWLMLKRIAPEFRSNPLYNNALNREFDLGFQLDHPNIVKYLNKGTDSEGLFLLAEWIDGTSLRQVLIDNPHGLKNFKLIDRIIQQLADALGYLHSRQIFHLDLKPENIIITHKGNNVKIIDFGLSGSDSYVPILAGTKKYAAPEQFHNPARSDARSDIYSFGVIILEMLTGKADLSELKKTNGCYRKLIEKCTTINPENRFQSTEDLKESITKKVSLKFFFLSGFFAFAVLVTIVAYYILSGGTAKIVIQDNIAFSKNRKPEINDNIDKKLIQPIINQPYTESRRRLDSLNNVHKEMLKITPTKSDSLRICKLGDEIYLTFLNEVKEFDDSRSARSRKLVLVEIKNKCIEAYNDSLNNHLTRYEVGSVYFEKLNSIFRERADSSEARMDNIIYGK